MSDLLTGTGPLFLAAEVEIYQPGGTASAAPGEAWGVLATGTLTRQPEPLTDFTLLRASDLGWVTRATDPAGIQAYAPILTSGVEIDRQMDLAPGGQGAAAGWGALLFANEAGALTTLALSRNADGRAVRLRLGRKVPAAYGWRDPAWGDTANLLAGIGAGWLLDETELRLTLRDPTYWLERPVDGATYAGTGGLEGNVALASKRKPRLRGGTATDPVREIAPVLVDPIAGIYQVSDALGAVVTLYERGLAGGIAFHAGVADITAAAPPPGTYSVESSSRGLFLRLGSFPPAGLITVDAWGAFPDGTAPGTAAGVALELLRQDLAVPATLLDAASFATLATACPWPAGIWLGADEAVDGAALAGLLLRSSAARLVPRRDGTLAAVALGPLPSGATPVASYTPAEIVDCTPRDLGPPLAPPPYRIRVGWGRNHTVQTSSLAPTLAGTRIQELAQAWRVAAAGSAEVSTAWRRPSDPPLVETALTSSAGANALAALLRDLWCVPAGRRLYDVSLPLPLALARDLGDVVALTYPGPLAAGALGRIVGEQIRTTDTLATLQVLT
jgi:hypothetical protein